MIEYNVIYSKDNGKTWIDKEDIFRNFKTAFMFAKALKITGYKIQIWKLESGDLIYRYPTLILETKRKGA